MTKNDKLESQRALVIAVEQKQMPSIIAGLSVFLSNDVDEKLAFLANLLLQSYKKVYKMSLTKRLFSLKRKMLAGIKRFLEE